ncbi:MAG: winged helix family transcriptional regulator [Dehalococcoidia bacterium]|nr:winged helix family transcriptional regulator [Dehalococcoidia bacterium]
MEEGQLSVGNLHIDLQTRQVWVEQSEVILTREEFDLLVYLIGHRARAVTVQEIEWAVWNGTLATPHASVRILVYRLRRKLRGLSPYEIRTVGGFGYGLMTGQAPAQEAS